MNDEKKNSNEKCIEHSESLMIFNINNNKKKYKKNVKYFFNDSVRNKIKTKIDKQYIPSYDDDREKEA